MIYSVEAVDVLFFRQPAPFEKEGETYFMGGFFPPLPGTYAGALKEFINDKGICNKEVKRARLKINFHGLGIDHQVYFPMPLDTYISKNKLITMQIGSKPISSYPLNYPLILDTNNAPDKKPIIDVYVSKTEFVSYINGETKKMDFITLSDYYVKEPKLGIGINPDSKTPQKKQMYEIQMYRPKKELKLLVEAENIMIPENAYVKLGGESKLAKINPWEGNLDYPAEYNDSKYFKLYYATPAVFANGWLPKWIDAKSMEGIFTHRGRRVKVKLLSAAVGKYVPVGGFGYCTKPDEKVFKPREMRYAVPAGSVYYFKLMEGRMEDVIKLFHQKCISDYREGLGFDYKIYNRSRYCDRGFGYVFVGKINEKQIGGFHV